VVSSVFLQANSTIVAQIRRLPVRPISFLEQYPLPTAPFHTTQSKLLIISLKTSTEGKLLATGWKTEGSEFESRCGQECSLLHVVQTDSEAHPASFQMGTAGKSARA
jgi:hypothetical protein